MSSDDEGPRINPEAKRRRLQRACDVCRRKKIRCDGVQMPGHQCTNCADYGLDCTYVENAKKRGPPKAYIESLEKRVAKLQEIIGTISPEALEQFNNSPNAPLVLPKPARTTPEQWVPYNPAPRRFIHHLRSSRSPSPPPDVDEPMSYLLDYLDAMRISPSGPRFYGKSSGIMLIKDAQELKRRYMGKPHDEFSSDGVERLHMNPLDSPAPAGPAYSFPETALILNLIDLYFRHVNRYLPLLHRPTFERGFSSGLHHADYGFATTLMLVCAVAAKYTDDPRVMDDPTEPGEKPDPHSSGWKWFQQVPGVKTAPLTPIDLYQLQNYALVGQFLQASSVPQACWTVVGIGIRIAQDVGAHRRRRTQECTVEDELWKRAFWVLVCMDRLFSSSTGRPCSIHDEDFDIDMPVECDDEYWEHPDPEQRWRQPEKTPSVITYFNVYIRLNQILAFLLRTVYATNKSRILHGFVGRDWEENIVAELDSALNAWLVTLPDHLRWDALRPNEVFFNQSASLFCFYQHIQILVHRQFIPSPSEPNKALSFPSLAICTQAARACSNALEAQRKRFGHAPAPPPLTTAAFSAGVILLLSIWARQHSSQSQNFDREMADVKKCMDVLKSAEVKWYLAGRLSDIIQELASVGDVPLPRRSSNSPKRERPEDGEETDDERPTSSSQAGSSGRFKKHSEPSLKDVVTRRAHSSAQIHNVPDQNFEFRPPQPQPLARQHPSLNPLNPQNNWPRQNAIQFPQKPYDTYTRPDTLHGLPPSQRPYNTYSRPDTLQMQPSESMPALGQNFGMPYSGDPGSVGISSSSSGVLRGSESGAGPRGDYGYRMGTDAAGSMSMDMSHRQRAGLDIGQQGAIADPNYNVWSNAPPGFVFGQWENYASGLSGQGAPNQGQYPHQG